MLCRVWFLVVVCLGAALAASEQLGTGTTEEERVRSGFRAFLKQVDRLSEWRVQRLSIVWRKSSIANLVIDKSQLPNGGGQHRDSIYHAYMILHIVEDEVEEMVLGRLRNVPGQINREKMVVIQRNSWVHMQEVEVEHATDSNGIHPGMSLVGFDLLTQADDETTTVSMERALEKIVKHNDKLIFTSPLEKRLSFKGLLYAMFLLSKAPTVVEYFRTYDPKIQNCQDFTWDALRATFAAPAPDKIKVPADCDTVEEGRLCTEGYKYFQRDEIQQNTDLLLTGRLSFLAPIARVGNVRRYFSREPKKLLERFMSGEEGGVTEDVTEDTGDTGDTSDTGGTSLTSGNSEDSEVVTSEESGVTSSEETDDDTEDVGMEARRSKRFLLVPKERRETARPHKTSASTSLPDDLRDESGTEMHESPGLTSLHKGSKASVKPTSAQRRPSSRGHRRRPSRRGKRSSTDRHVFLQTQEHAEHLRASVAQSLHHHRHRQQVLHASPESPPARVGRAPDAFAYGREVEKEEEEEEDPWQRYYHAARSVRGF